MKSGWEGPRNAAAGQSSYHSGLFKVYRHMDFWGHISECQKLAALPGLNACTGQWDLCWEKCLKVPHYSDEAHSPLTRFLLQLCPISIYFLISDSEGKGWKFAFNFHGNLSTSQEISACLSLAFSLDKQAFLPPVLFSHCSEVTAMGSGVHSLSWCGLDSSLTFGYANFAYSLLVPGKWP